MVAVGRYYFMLVSSSSLLLLLLLMVAPEFSDGLTCEVGGFCTPFGKFDHENIFSNVSNFVVVNKTCEECAAFHCLVDNNKVMTGFACADQIEKACKGMSEETKKVIKQQKYNEAFIFDNATYVRLCAKADGCATRDLLAMTPIEPYFLIDKFGPKGNKNNTKTCEYPLAEKSNGVINHTGGALKLLGMIVLAWSVSSFW